METLDLNINNYNLKDILNLFKIPIDFDESHMKQAKMTTLSMHPDKSRLPPDYFLFFSKAYKMLFQVYQVRYPDRKKNDRDNLSYAKIINRELGQESGKMVKNKEDKEYAKKQEEVFKKISKMEKKDFNEWFNEKFEKFKLQDEVESHGYENWFRGGEDEVMDDVGGTWSERNAIIEKKKMELRNKMALIEVNEIQTLDSMSGHYGLMREVPMEHSSGVFSSLQYEDLKKAHTESVIPVTVEDFQRRQNFNSMDELRNFRDLEKKTFTGNPYEQKMKFNNLKRIEAEEDVRRAYHLAKQDEIALELNKKLKASIFQIGNN